MILLFVVLFDIFHILIQFLLYIHHHNTSYNLLLLFYNDMLLFLVVLMYIKPWDMAMHGFQVPNWLPFRYSFIFSFMMLVMAFRAFEKLEGITSQNIGGIFFGLMVFLFWCERENYSHFKLFVTRKDTNGDPYNVIQGIWVSMLALAAYFALIYLVKKAPASKVTAISLVVVIGAELFLTAIDTIKKIDIDVAYSKYSSYEPYMSDLNKAVDMIEDFDTDPFYRMEATFHRTVNDAIGTGYKSVSHSSSTMNAPALMTLHRLGYAYGGHYTRYDGSTPLTDALFDIRYLMDKEGNTSYVSTRYKVPPEYKLATELTVEHGGKKSKDTTFKFYKNPNALGLGVAAKGDIEGVQLGDDDPFDNQNKLFSALTGSDEEFFTPVEVVKSDSENMVTVSTTDGHIKYSPADESNKECHIDYVVRMNRDSDLYMYLPTKYERSCNIWYQPEEDYIDGEYKMEYVGQFFTGDNYSIMKIGRFIEGQDIRVRITVANDENEAYWRDKLFYTFDYEGFSKACDKLKESSFEVTEFEDTALTGSVKAQFDGQKLFTTIPFEEGWSIEVNGKITATSGVIGGFTIGDKSIYKNISKLGGTQNTGVYLGTDGIQVGQGFKVDNYGNLFAKNATLSGKLIIGGKEISAADLQKGAASAAANAGTWTNGAIGGNNYTKATTNGTSAYPGYMKVGKLDAVSGLSIFGYSVFRNIYTINGVQYKVWSWS